MNNGEEGSRTAEAISIGREFLVAWATVWKTFVKIAGVYAGATVLVVIGMAVLLWPIVALTYTKTGDLFPIMTAGQLWEYVLVMGVWSAFLYSIVLALVQMDIMGEDSQGASDE